MKKYLVLLVCTLFCSAASFAQLSKDSLLKKMARETCELIAKKDLTNKSMEELQTELGMAMMPVIAKYEEDLKSVFGFSLDDPQGAEEMGKQVGVQLAKDCPAFLKMFMSNPDALKESGSSSGTKTPASGTVSGTLVKIVPGDFSYIQVKDASGKIEKIWWMEYFDGSNKLSSDPQSMINKSVKVKYVEKEIYAASLKDYMKVKVISGLE